MKAQIVPGHHEKQGSAPFSLQGPALVIEDLNSLNGTLVNGRQLLEPATLREGDEVQIGDVVMKVNRR